MIETTLVVNSDTRDALKIRAIQEKTTLRELTERMAQAYLSSPIVKE